MLYRVFQGKRGMWRVQAIAGLLGEARGDILGAKINSPPCTGRHKTRPPPGLKVSESFGSGYAEH